MTQDRNGNFLNSVLRIFRKTSKHESETRDASALESRRRLDERIESVLKDTISPSLSLWEPVEPQIAPQAYSGTGVSALALSNDNPSEAENGMMSESSRFARHLMLGFGIAVE